MPITSSGVTLLKSSRLIDPSSHVVEATEVDGKSGRTLTVTWVESVNVVMVAIPPWKRIGCPTSVAAKAAASAVTETEVPVVADRVNPAAGWDPAHRLNFGTPPVNRSAGLGSPSVRVADKVFRSV